MLFSLIVYSTIYSISYKSVEYHQRAILSPLENTLKNYVILDFVHWEN